MKKYLFLSSMVCIGLLASCNNPSERNDEVIDLGEEESASTTMEPENDAPESYEKDGLKIYPAPASVEYKDAMLQLKSPKDEAMAATGDLSFDFEVTNYELGAQTTDAEGKGLANSAKGQHIHLIVDNGPYSAHYEPDFTKSFENGHHVAIAFLSRSYHESVKNANSYQVFQFTTGESDMKTTDLSKPLLFYSRPKGEYKGEDTKKILLDFFLVNADLKPDGYSVKVTVNGTSFEFDTWQPYLIEGLPMGENTIKLELVDAKGSLVSSDMNSVSRTFTLTE